MGTRQGAALISALSFIPYGRQSAGEEDVAAVCDVLRSDFLTSGSKVEEFGRRFAVVVGAKHCVAVNSALLLQEPTR